MPFSDAYGNTYTNGDPFDRCDAHTLRYPAYALDAPGVSRMTCPVCHKHIHSTADHVFHCEYEYPDACATNTFTTTARARTVVIPCHCPEHWHEDNYGRTTANPGTIARSHSWTAPSRPKRTTRNLPPRGRILP